MKLVRWAKRLRWVLLTPRERANAVHEWSRWRRGEPAFPAGPIRHVIVVCHGNICRSPFAGELLAGKRKDLRVRSAGLEAGTDAPAEPAAQRVASRLGVDLSAHRSRPLLLDDIDWADLILTMEAHQSLEVARRRPQDRAKVRLLGDYLEDPPHSIPDPWGRDDAFFEQVFDRIASAIQRVETVL